MECEKPYLQRLCRSESLERIAKAGACSACVFLDYGSLCFTNDGVNKLGHGMVVAPVEIMELALRPTVGPKPHVQRCLSILAYFFIRGFAVLGDFSRLLQRVHSSQFHGGGQSSPGIL